MLVLPLYGDVQSFRLVLCVSLALVVRISPPENAPRTSGCGQNNTHNETRLGLGDRDGAIDTKMADVVPFPKWCSVSLPCSQCCMYLSVLFLVVIVVVVGGGWEVGSSLSLYSAFLSALFGQFQCISQTPTEQSSNAEDGQRTTTKGR